MRVQIARVMALAVAASISSLSLLAQDECSTATALALGVNGPFDSTGSTVSAPAWGCSNVTGGDVWYSFTTPGLGGLLTIDTEGSVMSDTVLEIFDGCGGASVACDDDGGTGNLSSITFVAAGNTTYYARVGGYGGSFGVHNVNVAFSSPDECTGAIPVVDGPNGPFSNVGATTSVPASSCSSMNSDIWFVHQASCTGTLTVQTVSAGAGSLTDTVMEAWDACGGAVLGCDDDGGTGTMSLITIPVTAGSLYYFRVGDYGAAVSQGLINLSIVNAPSPGALNDACACAYPVVNGLNGPFDSTGSTVSAPSWPCLFIGASGGDVWYSYTMSACGDLTVDTNGSSFDTGLQVFDASGGCGNLVSLGCSDDISFPSNPQSLVTVTGLVTGQAIAIRVGGYNGAVGLHNVNVVETPVAQANDECVGAIPVALGMNGPFNNGCATSSAEAWACGGSGASHDVWYTFTAGLNSPHTFRTCGADFDTKIEIFDGVCGSLTSIGCNDDATSGPCGFPQSSLTVSLTNGVTYYVRVGGYNGANGTFPLEVVLGNGTGSISVTTPSLCTVPGLDLSVTGSPTIGGTVTTSLTGATGMPFVIMTLSLPAAGLPGCPCMTFASPGAPWIFGTSISVTVPANALFLGLPVQTQGIDLLTATGACGAYGVNSSFSDIYTILFN
jgi:hypothetical protein